MAIIRIYYFPQGKKKKLGIKIEENIKFLSSPIFKWVPTLNDRYIKNIIK